MPQVVEEFPTRGRPRSSEFDAYLDGQRWRLDIGVDVEGTAQSARTKIQHAAKRLGKKARTAVEGDFLYVQAFEAPEEESHTNGDSAA